LPRCRALGRWCWAHAACRPSDDRTRITGRAPPCNASAASLRVLIRSGLSNRGHPSPCLPRALSARPSTSTPAKASHITHGPAPTTLCRRTCGNEAHTRPGRWPSNGSRSSSAVGTTIRPTIDHLHASLKDRNPSSTQLALTTKLPGRECRMNLTFLSLARSPQISVRPPLLPTVLDSSGSRRPSRYREPQRNVCLDQEIDNIVRLFRIARRTTPCFFGKASGFHRIHSSVLSYLRRICSAPSDAMKHSAPPPPEDRLRLLQGKNRQAFHGVRRRRINLSCEMGLLLPDR